MVFLKKFLCWKQQCSIWFGPPQQLSQRHTKLKMTIIVIRTDHILRPVLTLSKFNKPYCVVSIGFCAIFCSGSGSEQGQKPPFKAVLDTQGASFALLCKLCKSHLSFQVQTASQRQCKVFKGYLKTPTFTD